MRSTMKRFVALFVSFALITTFAFPTTALAARVEVDVENHALYGQRTVSGLSIDGVDAPAAGKALDNVAVVKTAESESWDIPVLWVGDDWQLANEAAEGHTYLPALAFFVPGDFSLEGDTFTVTLSDSLAELFGDSEIVSVYVSITDITYIVPASLRNFFVLAQPQIAPDKPQVEPVKEQAPSIEEDPDLEPPADVADVQERNLIDVWCAQTARDAFTDEDLNWVIDLVVNKLQPQAVNLLIDKFPAFAEGAQNGEIGMQIGLYIYLNKGDKDGKPEHESASSALAYVSGDAVPFEGVYKYGYMIGLDLDDLTLRDAGQVGGYVHNPETGKYQLMRSGQNAETLENTIVHEMFHAFMDDYNRTGMIGALDINDAVTNPDGTWKSEEQMEKYEKLAYPRWFKEGSASAVENVYQFRADLFDLIYPKDSDTDSRSNLLQHYLNTSLFDNQGTRSLIDISESNAIEDDYTKQDATISKYVSGYLATLYLSELAARTTDSIGSSKMTTDDGKRYYSADNLRMGLNSILERMHNGETMDDVVKSISTIQASDGKTAYMYEDVADFEDKFIKGEFSESEDEDDELSEADTIKAKIADVVIGLRESGIITDELMMDDEAFTATIIKELGDAGIKSSSGKPLEETEIRAYIEEIANEPDDEPYVGDDASIEFVTDYLDYLRSFETGGEGGFVANGSILFNFDRDFYSPLDPQRESSSDYYKIVEDNGYVESTVPDSEALKGGGKSRLETPNVTPQQSEATKSESAGSVLLEAAKVNGRGNPASSNDETSKVKDSPKAETAVETEKPSENAGEANGVRANEDKATASKADAVNAPKEKPSAEKGTGSKPATAKAEPSDSASTSGEVKAKSSSSVNSAGAVKAELSDSARSSDKTNG